MLKGGYKNKEKPTLPSREYQAIIKPKPIYKYPKEHPCYGCVFTLQTDKPSCMTGNTDINNCINTFYKRMLLNRKQKIN